MDLLYKLEWMAVFNSNTKERNNNADYMARLLKEDVGWIEIIPSNVFFKKMFASDNIIDFFASYFNCQISKYVSCSHTKVSIDALSATWANSKICAGFSI